MLLYLLPIALGGCASMMHQADSHPGSTSANEAGKPSQPQDSTLGMGAHANKPAKDASNRGRDRNGFSDKLTPEQQYNAHLELGRFQESQENFDLALGEYLKALEACESHATLLSGPKNLTKQALAHRRMASSLDRLGRFEQAELEYSAALKLSPNDPKIWNDAGYSFYLQGRWADAERALKTAAKLDPNNTRVMTNLGLNLAASGRSEEALAEFTKAGGQAVAHADLAYILAGMGKTAEAESHYRKALELQPQMEVAKQALTALSARTAHEAQVAAASRSTAPALIDRPGVLPVAGVRPPAPAGPTLVAQAPSVKVPATSPRPSPSGPVKPATMPTQAQTVARVAPVVPVDSALLRTVAPAPRRAPPATPPIPVPAPMPLPGPVPTFVPPGSS